MRDKETLESENAGLFGFGGGGGGTRLLKVCKLDLYC